MRNSNFAKWFVPPDLFADDDEDNDAWKDTKKWSTEPGEGECKKCGGKLKLLDTGWTARHYYCPKCKE